MNPVSVAVDVMLILLLMTLFATGFYKLLLTAPHCCKTHFPLRMITRRLIAVIFTPLCKNFQYHNNVSILKTHSDDDHR